MGTPLPRRGRRYLGGLRPQDGPGLPNSVPALWVQTNVGGDPTKFLALVQHVPEQHANGKRVRRLSLETKIQQAMLYMLTLITG